MSPQATYQTANVGNVVELGFLDSWQHVPVADRPASYRTIIAVHGVGFNSSVWLPLLAHLPADVRFIAYNQRGYAQSSPALAPQKAGGTDIMSAYAFDLLDFVNFAVKEFELPPQLTILGWSRGSAIALSALAAIEHGHDADSASLLSSIPVGFDFAKAYPFLETPLKSVVLYDTYSTMLGQALTPDAIAAFLPVMPPNPATPDQIADAFLGWVVGSPGDAGATSLDELRQAWGAEDAWDAMAAVVGFGWSMGDESETARLAKAEIFSDKFKVGIIYATDSPEYCSSGIKTIAEWAKEVGKPSKVVLLEGANHFAMSLKPKQFWEAVEQLI